MAATVALSELRQRARELADMETSAQASAFVDDTELNRRINSALKRLYNKLVILRGDEYYGKSTTIDTIDGQATYPLPSDFFQLLHMSVSDGTREYALAKWNFKDWSALKWTENTQTSDASFYRYKLMGTSFEIRPKPATAAHTFTIYYLPAFVPLVKDGDVFDGVNGWEDWACYTAAIAMLIKEESFEQANALERDRAMIDDQINALAGNRDAGLPEVVGDNIRDWGGYYGHRLFNDWNW